MKTDRLFSIVHILLNKGRVTAKELADQFEVSTRTIYRDIDSLSTSGIPIYTDKGTGGGISLLENYVLNKTVISETEKNSILLGLEVLEATHYQSSDTAISKLKHLFDGEQNAYVEVDFSDFSHERQPKIFENIKRALQKNQTLKMIYKNNSGEKTERIVDPLKLIFKQQRWYLVAYCHKRRDYRTFRISRILDTEITSESFNRKDYDISDWVLKSHEMKHMKPVVLTLDAKALFRVEEEFPLSGIVHQEDQGILLVTFEAEMDDWLLNYIMTYADYLIDIEPSILKERLKDKAQKILNI
ncbi:helix-turn-helix transcriptional regulator [Fusibacter ferrireducens]|uniref:YafY family transcriptional regulator n=1 Tax=Fusibacter ferrireducens TaxID=2785058 RepID=A0ABR9ZPV6_9FIRM|nr:YafY family protein [Fusibacter ferrireducens]MBF4692472.1 YafY family transcriptional regulator [Fusibacter ferrireducens]